MKKSFVVLAMLALLGFQASRPAACRAQETVEVVSAWYGVYGMIYKPFDKGIAEGDVWQVERAGIPIGRMIFESADRHTGKGRFEPFAAGVELQAGDFLTSLDKPAAEESEAPALEEAPKPPAESMADSPETKAGVPEEETSGLFKETDLLLKKAKEEALPQEPTEPQAMTEEAETTAMEPSAEPAAAEVEEEPAILKTAPAAEAGEASDIVAKQEPEARPEEAKAEETAFKETESAMGIDLPEIDVTERPEFGAPNKEDEEAAASLGAKAVRMMEERSYQDAVELLRQAILLTPDNPSFHLNLAAAYDSLGKVDYSRWERNQYLALAKNGPPLPVEALKPPAVVSPSLAAVEAEPEPMKAKAAAEPEPMKAEAAPVAVAVEEEAAPEPEIKMAAAAPEPEIEPVAPEEPPAKIQEPPEKISFDPVKSNEHNDRGTDLAMANKLDEAEKEYRLAISYNPQSPYPHLNLAVIHAKKGRLEDARQEASRAAELGDGRADDLLNYLQGLPAVKLSR